jgi:LysM repeat protein
MRPFYPLLIILSFPFSGNAQQDSVVYLSASDTLVTFVHPMGELMFTHTLEPGQTLFSLAKTYGLSMPEL